MKKFFSTLISLILFPSVAYADFCDFFPDVCEQLQEEIDQLEAQAQQQIDQAQTELETNYQETLDELQSIDLQQGSNDLATFASSEQGIELINQSEQQLQQLRQDYDNATGEAKQIIEQQLAILEAEYLALRDEYVERLQQQVVDYLNEFQLDIGSMLGANRLSQYNQSAGIRNRTLPEGVLEGINSRIGVFATGDGYGVPYSYQPFKFGAFDLLFTEGAESQSKLLAQASLFYSGFEDFYIEGRYGQIFEGADSRSYRGIKLNHSDGFTTFGIDAEEGGLELDFSYRKQQLMWGLLWKKVSWLNQLNRIEYLNEDVESKLLSFDFSTGFRINTQVIPSMPVGMDLDFIFTAPNYTILQFDGVEYDLRGEEWTFTFGISQQF